MESREAKPWTREELILAINLYCRTPLGRIYVRYPEIIALAELLGRTPGSVSYKLANLATINPRLKRQRPGSRPWPWAIISPTCTVTQRTAAR